VIDALALHFERSVKVLRLCILHRLGGVLLTASALIACLPDHRLEAQGLLYVSPDGGDAGTGTRASPFRTIARAAEVARAGDIVRIRPGTYSDAVRVAGEGSRDQPIMFEAEVPGTVVLTGEDAGFAPLSWAGDDDVLLQSGNRWVTLRGLSFRRIGDRPAVRASSGWRVEDCVFEKLSIGVNVRGHDVTVTRSIFQDIDSQRAHAVVAYGGRNLRLSDLVIQRVNQQRLVEEISHSAVSKFLFVDGLVIEGVVSRDNVGPGLWLDSSNTNFVIRQSYVAGNQGDQYYWEGAGMWIENNPSANGQIYENVITGNSGAGIEIMESSDIAVHDNVLLGNDTCISLRNLDRGAENDGIRDLRIERNVCGDWKSAGITTGIGEWANWQAASRRVTIDGGLYLVSPEDAPIFHWLGEQAMTLQESRTKFGFAAGGVATSARMPSASASAGDDRTEGANEDVEVDPD
jgi:Right handed beta helix region/Protein of unknown function (DUF1565)